MRRKHWNGTNPFNGHPVDYMLTVEKGHLSWNGENVVLFVRSHCIDFGWQSDPDGIRDALADTLDRTGVAGLLRWVNTFPGNQGRYDAEQFIAQNK
jgi:hypothetical protein